jgi:prepilin-type N-terminal cleavage/methylation domain-containing protein
MKIRIRNAFTLLEVIIVVVILAILVSIAIPNMKKFITRAQLKEVGSMVELIKSGAKYYDLKYGLNLFSTSGDPWINLKLEQLATVPGLTYTFGTSGSGINTSKYIIAWKDSTEIYRYYFYGPQEGTGQKNSSHPDVNSLPADLP